MHTEKDPRHGFKDEIIRKLKRFRISSREPPRKSQTEIFLPQEEIDGLMAGMDLLKMGDRFLHEEKDGRINYRVSVKQKELEGLSDTLRGFLLLGTGANGELQMDFSYDQRDFGIVRRVVAVERRKRKVELVVQDNKDLCDLNLEHPDGFELPMSDENRRLLANDVLVIIKAGLNKFSIGRTGSF